jgi:hypothetical protein
MNFRIVCEDSGIPEGFWWVSRILETLKGFGWRAVFWKT